MATRLNGLQSAAMRYCKIRVTTASVSSVMCAVVLIVLSFFVRRWMGDTGTYTPTQGTVRGGSVAAEQHKGAVTYTVNYDVEYTVSNKKYYTTVSGPGGFGTRAYAQSALDSAINTRVVTIYVDPSDPAKNTTIRNREDYLMMGMLVVGGLALTYGIISYVLRDNPIMCGMQVASNVHSIFRN